jgi:hypothetical protein
VAEKVEIITVKSNRKDNRVALWEKDERHPEGEIFVAGEKVVKAAKTPAVAKKLRDGELVEVKAGAAAKSAS